ncbi:hypothetical protein CAPTEDRAFT_185637 [Capitella teleta]|uniref:Uncharacterized protein n=1 Tax=Capitella teleta TaxID=283909 RepID=R7UJY3_CAPTE|nr:hypothetical protein CAPTEDRAFT_185637 [Capitella teleta]|eukprot:ELU03572.1 hypothetical protein CAPTEDRAFT_185637 [Capitella teleta]
MKRKPQRSLVNDDASAIRRVFVAVDGYDHDTCGAPSDPCLTLNFSLSLVERKGKIIVRQHTSVFQDQYFFCHEEPLQILGPVEIISQKSAPRAFIGCPSDANRMLMFNVTGGLSFRNMRVSRAFIYIYNGDVTFTNSEIRGITVNSEKRSSQTTLIVKNSTWFSANQTFNMTLDTMNVSTYKTINNQQVIHGESTRFEVTNSKFYDSKFDVMGAECQVSVVNSTFKGLLQDMNMAHAGLHIAIGDKYRLSRIVIQNSNFVDQVYYNPVQSIMNLYDATVLVRTVDRSPNRPPYHVNVSVDITDSVFYNNERGLSFFGPFEYININSCLFKENIAMHAGAGILFLTNTSSPSYLFNCTFDSNSAGFYKAESVENSLDSFKVSGDEVRIQSECCKGIISFVGKGGGIRVQRGNVTLSHCKFINNTVRLLGGAIFVDRDSTLHIDEVFFENSPDGKHSLQGDLLYSNGVVEVKSAQLSVLRALDHVAILRHSGDHWSIEVMDVFVHCPTGFRLRVTNTSAYGVNPDGLRRSYKLDQLSYFCESCPRNRYSLDYGYMNYSLVYSQFAFYTLLINGEKPETAYSGSYEYHDIECLQCPYGGKCQLGITAVANFWGYITGNHVKFQHCPKGYCCTSTDCTKFNTCAKHRKGRLCGECEDDYSEALFSAECVPNKLCDPTWLYPVAFGSGILYVLFLLFQKDIRDLMFMKSVHLNEINFPHRRKTYNSIQMNNITSNNHSNELTQENGEIETSPALIGYSNVEQDNGMLKNNNLKHENGVNQVVDEAEVEVAAQPAVDTGASFLIILFYYFQDAQLLHIKTVFATVDNKSKLMLKEILSGLFKFRIELFQFMDKMCFLAGLSPSSKMLITALIVPYVIFQFAVIYLIYRWCSGIHVKIKTRRQKDEEEESPGESNKTFSSRLATGFVLALLFTYQKLATTSFTLLNCVPIGHEKVLFIQGTIACYEGWQYGVMAYAITCSTPFCLVLLIGPGLLKDGLIGLPQFFSACMLPLPFLLYWIAIRLTRFCRGMHPPNAQEMSSESQAVINILQGPFKDSENRVFGPLCGQGILIGRRLILIVLFTFVNDTLIRMLCMMLVCFVILLHHVHALPYKDTRGNLAGTASAAALVIVGGINLVRAGFEAAEYTPQGPNQILMKVFEELENVLMLWFPAVVMGLVFISLSVKLVLLLLKRIFNSSDVPVTARSTSAL